MESHQSYKSERAQNIFYFFTSGTSISYTPFGVDPAVIEIFFSMLAVHYA